MKITILTGALTLLVGATAVAQPATPGVDRREATQERRIEQGVHSGQLTQQEAHRLEHQQQRIDRAESRAKADGQVSARERERLHHMQDRASRDIAREKHDRQHDMNHDGRRDRPHASRPGPGR